MSSAMNEALEKATVATNEFTKEHPVLFTALITLTAIGVMVILLPWAVEALGFGELGPLAGWSSMYFEFHCLLTC